MPENESLLQSVEQEALLRTPEREDRTTEPDAPKTDGETELWEFLVRLSDDATKGKDEQADVDDWENAEKVFWGDQWDTSLPSFKLPIVVNELKTYILTEVSDLTDNPIKVYVHKDQTKGEQDKNVEQAIQAFWVNEFVDLQIMHACLDSMIYPAGFLMCTAEKQQDGTYGVKVKAIDPRKVFPDPDCTSEEDWRFVLVKDVLDVVLIRDWWPERGWRVNPDDAYSVKSANSSPTSTIRAAFGSSQYKGPLNSPGLGTRQAGYLKARAEVLYLYIYDDETEDDIQVKKDPTTKQPVLDEMGAEQLVVTRKKKYPNGRMIVGSNGVILFDGPYPYTGPFPIVRVVAEPTTHQFWVSKSPVEGVRELARAGNKMDSLVVENGIRLNVGTVIADTDSGLRPGQMVAQPGQIQLKRTGTQIQIIYPPPMPPDMVNGGQRFRDYMAKVLGMPPQRVGAGNRGNVSPELAETEISQAMGLSRLRARLLHASVQKLTEQIFHRMAQYYTLPRIIPYINASEWKPVAWEPIAKAQDYGVHVDPASFMLRSKTMLQRLVMALSAQGKVSTKYLLTMLDLPDADQEAEKADKQMQMQYEIAQAKKRR